MDKGYFNGLAYSLGDEDANVELKIAPPNGNIFGICGSGARILPLLSLFPTKLTCIDISPAQISLAKLRMETIDNFTHNEYCGFWGYEKISPKERKDMLLSLQCEDKKNIADLFELHQWREPIYYGKFEKSLIKISKVVKSMLGKDYMKIFESSTLSEQQHFFRTLFPRTRFNIIVAILGNASFLNAILYKGEFPEKNIAGSHYSHFKRIFESIFTEVPVQNSYFLQLVLLGEIRYYNNIPEVNFETFTKMKEALGQVDVQFVKGNIYEEIGRCERDSLDYVSLSDVPSFVAGIDGHSFNAMVSPYLRKGGLMVYNGFLRQIAPPMDTSFQLLNDEYDQVFSDDSTRLWKYNVLKKTHHV